MPFTKGYRPSPETIEKLRRAATGHRASPATRAKMRAAKLGKPKTAEHAANISRGRMGIAFSAETRAKMSAAKMGHSVSTDTIDTIRRLATGRHHSLETRSKMRTSAIGKPKTAEHAANIARARTGIKRSAATIAKMSVSMKASVARRGFTPEERAKRSARFKGRLNPAFGIRSTHGPRSHWVDYNGTKLRSSYEVVLAKGFDALGIQWLYEPTRFDLGTCTYLPDFYLPELGVYWEAKGYFDPESRRRTQLFRQLHPDKPLVVATEIVINQWRRLIA